MIKCRNESSSDVEQIEHGQTEKMIEHDWSVMEDTREETPAQTQHQNEDENDDEPNQDHNQACILDGTTDLTIRLQAPQL